MTWSSGRRRCRLAAPVLRAGLRAGLRVGLRVGLVVLLVLVVGCTAPARNVAAAHGQSAPTEYRGGVTLPVPYPMPDVTLTDTTGDDYDLLSSPSTPATLLFFGYTHCPDVCPDVLSAVASALTRMPDGTRDQIQLIFVTTDPARDTGAVIARYLRRFDPSFLGLTGDLRTITTTAAHVGVDIKGVQRLPDGGYDVGHSAQVLGFDRSHRAVVQWLPSTPIGDLTADFELLVSRQQ